MINTNIVNNFVNVSYDYIVDNNDAERRYVNVNSNSVAINLIKKNLDVIPSSASIEYNYVVDPTESNKIAVKNTDILNTLFSYASLKTSRKISDMKYADIDDSINYVITVTNNGNLPANDIIFKDPMPDGVEFVLGSIVIDGEPISDLSKNPNSGFNIGMIPPKMFKVITFKVKVIGIPSNNDIRNIAQFSYNFSLNENDSTKKVFGKDTTGKPTITKVLHADLSKIKKEIDNKDVCFGDIVTYKTTIPNTGNIDAININFHECISNKTKLIEGSIEVIVDDIVIYTGLGKENDSIINLKIDKIPPKTEAIITFKVKVIN